jgi:hypothetical protein
VPPKDDFLSGFTAPIANIKEQGESLFKLAKTGKYEPSQPKPELVGEGLGSLTAGKSSNIKGGFTLFNPESLKSLGELGTNFTKAPIYYTGSAITGVALTAVPPGKFIGGGKAAIAAASTRGIAKDVLPILRQTANMGKTSAASKTIIDMERGFLGVGRESEGFKYVVGLPPKVTRQGVSREYFMSNPLTKVQKGDLLTGDPQEAHFVRATGSKDKRARIPG